MNNNPIIEIENLGKTFVGRAGEVKALENINLTINEGEIFGVIGLSGAGKSTLVRCINLLEKPTEGSVTVNGENLTSLSQKDLLKARQSIGMIFQGFNLLAQRTALKNICFPMELAGFSKQKARARALELLELVGLSDKANAYPSQLSGGQKQRVAIARALATEPKVLLCDEATSALDPNTTQSILQLLKDINKMLGVTIVIITHEMKVIEQICHRVAVIDHSNIVEIGNVKEVFLKPQSDIAKQLIFPKGEGMQFHPGEKCLRLVFDGDSSFEPVISALSLECHAMVNILFADTKVIDDKVFGQMVIGLPNDEIAVARILNFLDNRKITYKEEKPNVV